MSRERPTKLPEHRHFDAASKVIQKHDEQALRRHEERERLKNFSGPGFMGGLMGLMTKGAKPSAQFIRRGYEADIIDDLRDFFTRRPRPWRQKHRQAGMTFKERVKAQRQFAHCDAVVRKAHAAGRRLGLSDAEMVTAIERYESSLLAPGGRNA